jgi:hypothetical protein
MFYGVFLLFVSIGLFAQSTATSVASTGNVSGGQPAIYVIDPMQRGKDLFDMFVTLSKPTLNTSTSEIAIQTTRNGLISDVVGINPAKNYTVFIVQYFVRNNFSQYIVVPVEQITEMIYSTTTISGNFGSTVTTGLLPVFEMDMIERAQDVIDIFAKLSTGVYKTGSSQVALQTTLTGPYYASSLKNGLIPNIQSISLNESPYGTLLLVAFRQSNSQKTDFFIVVPTEQIFAINYFQGS